MGVPFWSSKRLVLLTLLLIILLTTACGSRGSGANWPGLSADADTLYFARGSELIALDAATQQVMWRLPAASSTALMLASPEVGESHIYIGDYGLSQGLLSPGVLSSVFAVRKDSRGDLTIAEGSSNPLQNNHVAKDRIISSPLLADGKLFVGTSDDYLLALDSETLEILWGSETRQFNHSIWGKPAFANGIVVATSLDKTVRAFDADTGAELWMNETKGAIAASPIILDDMVFVAGFDAKVHAFDLQSGAERWIFETSNWIWNAPAILDNTLFFGDTDGIVYAVDATSGELQWQQPQAGIVQAPLIVHDDQLIVPLVIGVSTDEQSGEFLSLSPTTGDLQWRQSTSSPTFTAPVIVQDKLVVVMTNLAGRSNNSTLQALDLATGGIAWAWSATAVAEAE